MNMDTPDFSGTVATMYQAAMNPSLWREVAERLAHLFDADAVVLCHTEGEAVKLLGDGYYNVDSDQAERLPGEYAQPAATTRRVSDHSARAPRTVDDAAFARDVKPATGRGRVLTVVIPEIDAIEGCAPAHLSVAHAEGRVRFSSQQQDLRLLVSQHLLGAARMQRALARKQRTASFHSTAVLHLGEAWLVIDANDRVVDCNPLARSFLLRSDIVRLEHGRLTLPDRQAELVLREAILAGWTGEEIRTIAMSPDGGQVSFDVLPIYGANGRSDERPEHLMVLVHELKRDIMLKIERQAEAFALSRAEKRVMVHLVRSGQTPAGIAALLGTSERTVRCQLSSIFRKTGTRNQQELIRMTLVG